THRATRPGGRAAEEDSMRAIRSCVAGGIACALALVMAPPAHGQLYGDKKELTQGELNEQDYWWAKFDDMMLDLALEQHQPDGAIGLQLVSMQRRLDDLAKKYPKHEDVKRWKEHADQAQKKIDPNADRHASFRPECPWNEAN